MQLGVEEDTRRGDNRRLCWLYNILFFGIPASIMIMVGALSEQELNSQYTSGNCTLDENVNTYKCNGSGRKSFSLAV